MKEKIELNSSQLREVRKALKLTQKKFAGQFGLKDYIVRDMERGKTKVPSPLSMLIVREFNVNQAWLAEGEGDIFAQPSAYNYAQQKDHKAFTSQLAHAEKVYDSSLSDSEYRCLSLFRSLKGDLQELYLSRMKTDLLEQRIEEKKRKNQEE